ncbi:MULTISPECIES: succinate dehydrogenase, cytochrome b556 subunit [Pseudoxanthomonas]|jgi:succinate dehydrogenase / fumarate reductase cytochrome b subunit|uniref:Succinate dehydrogenase cytochrome b556 subunit n=1 Tax=Pseudoxanthomonas winnipegensis TaxID=2480810 RepID=A0A4Q8L6Y8_9GAMM|nr:MULTISPECIES: succinate dehydrogenase, cytochrome b556 subunit [Pseudoxanthomonas]PZP63094.1 MAG: succinate dehydrogenase, cytochrome b556 subunit [Pseudoxanthomonas spadix]TAA23718.1 succinate dehydrogenase, cytochrome b556 subunit [Pseudoxanthomonas winnipegensis]TMN17911.1 succinate dehydrogenase, cytochrome b556 subunit [Pseudoxanthomonas sp. X-1]UAY76465.1 succinate dehydrogenase, cytochrome b556 subunit [Pseudoxanthomonas sp. X-1]
MATRQRPLSPHLQVYRWQIQMATSILHRATGIILSLGALLIAAALVSLASGPDAWAWISAQAGSWYGLVFLFLWTWAFTYHLLNGIRHLAQDGGLGYAVAAFVRNGWLVSAGSLVLAVLIWGGVLAKGGVA